MTEKHLWIGKVQWSSGFVRRRVGSKNCTGLKVPGVEDVRVVILEIVHVVAKPDGIEERRIPVVRCLSIRSAIQRVVLKINSDVFR